MTLRPTLFNPYATLALSFDSFALDAKPTHSAPSTLLHSTRIRPANLLPRRFCPCRPQPPKRQPDLKESPVRRTISIAHSSHLSLRLHTFGKNSPLHPSSSFSITTAIGIPVSSVIYATGDFKGEAAERLSLMPASYGSSQFQKNRKHPLFHWMNKFKSNANSYAKGICDHVSLGSTVSQTVKGKLSLGMQIIQAGGRRLENIAFRSNRCIKLTSSGETARVPYKVIILLSRTKRACQSVNINKPSQKYIQIITEDDFEFWFMGFLCYERSFNFIHKQLH